MKPITIILAILLLSKVSSSLAQQVTNNSILYPNPSDDGRTVYRNSAGQLVFTASLAEGNLKRINSMRFAGNLQKALALCDEIIATNTTERRVFNARMQIFGDMGEFSKAEHDFLFLTEHFPKFYEAYDSWAYILLQQGVSESGKDQFLDWLNSPEQLKKTAAKNAIIISLIASQNNVTECLKSPDMENQLAALRVLQMGLKLRPNKEAKQEK